MDEILSYDANKFVGVDFHIHTPASYCYKGQKTDEEYLEILLRYVDKKVKVLAITDHNTIRGYKKITKLKMDMEIKLKYLSELSEKYPDVGIEYDNLKTKLNFFNELLILPGVEFEANPGIHLLLIFNPDSDLNKVENFLVEAGYTEDIQGKENPGIIPKYDVLNVLNEANSLGAIVIAAHADSDKGIYNSLEKNQYRASVFRSNNLNAISYNNPITCQKMRGLFENKEYKRQTPIAFIQCSDYHGNNEAASCITYLKLDEIDFESVYNALKNPNECVSPTQHPQVVNILKQIINDARSFVFENLETNEEKLSITRAACAAINEGYGTLVIGAVTKPTINIIGVKKSIEELKQILSPLFKSIKPTMFDLQMSGYKFGENRWVVVIWITREINTIAYVNEDEVYIYKSGKVIQATPTQIENIVEEKLFHRMDEHQKIINSKFDSIIREIEILKESSLQLHLINKIEKNSIILADIVNIECVDQFVGDIEMPKANGSVDGNVMIVDGIEVRLDDAYLRCTCPKTNQYSVGDFDNIKKFVGKAVVIVPLGGTYYVDADGEWCIISMSEYLPTLVLTIKDTWKQEFTEFSIVAWLKSSVLIWYCDTVFGSINIHDPDIFKKIVVPNMDKLKRDEDVCKNVNKIIQIENEFLSIDINSLNDENYNEMVLSHNRRIDLAAYEIDKSFFEELELTTAEVEMIKQFFDFKGIHNVILDVNDVIATEISIDEAACTIEE